MECLQARDKAPGSCSTCAVLNGCLDPTLAGTCEDVAGDVAGCGGSASERQICLRTMSDVFSSGCAATLQQTPCVCGTVDPGLCLTGQVPPNGPVLPDYFCDFGSFDMNVLISDFTMPAFGVGMANNILQCVAAFGCDCF